MAGSNQPKTEVLSYFPSGGTAVAESQTRYDDLETKEVEKDSMNTIGLSTEKEISKKVCVDFFFFFFVSNLWARQETVSDRFNYCVVTHASK